jgi:hypothetical protein
MPKRRSSEFAQRTKLNRRIPVAAGQQPATELG